MTNANTEMNAIEIIRELSVQLAAAELRATTAEAGLERVINANAELHRDMTGMMFTQKKQEEEEIFQLEQHLKAWKEVAKEARAKLKENDNSIKAFAAAIDSIVWEAEEDSACQCPRCS